MTPLEAVVKIRSAVFPADETGAWAPTPDQVRALLDVAEAAAWYREAQGREHEGFEAQDAAQRAALGLDYALDALVKVASE